MKILTAEQTKAAERKARYLLTRTA